MDEDAGVRAPVTRLRRRLSVEQTEESKSPVTVNTPTKKRGGRKTAKPELELIDENTPDNTTRKTTKKTAPKDVTIPEEKPVTPARRSTRVKSNTSIVSEAALVVDSPRTRRATRRASLAGSDSEVPLTPIRQTRRTRKESTSSVENEPQLASKQGIQITEVIIEEPEIKSTAPEIATNQSNSPNSIRKSPRLLEKSNISPIKIIIEESSNNIQVSENTATIPNKTSSSIVGSTNLSLQDTTDEQNNTKDGSEAQNNKTQTSQNRLSTASIKLIYELNPENTKKSNLNKSWSDAESKKFTTKRQRTKSWTTLSGSNDSQFHSDNESAKNRIKNSIKSPLMPLNKRGSGDDLLNTTLNQSLSNKSILNRKKKDSMNFVVENIHEPLDKINNIEKECKNEILSHSQNNINNNNTKISEVLEKKPSGDIKAKVYIDDSDSNSDKLNTKRHINEDQCVPVVEHDGETSPLKVNSFTSIVDNNAQNILNKSKDNSQMDSESMDCEPMDIDETIPENFILPEMQSTELNTSGRKSTSVHNSILSCAEIVNNSERKSSITQIVDKSEIETKSTLILSQIKDTSTSDINKTVKSPAVINNKLLSKSVDDLNITQENDIKKNLSLHYSTSTPLQDKNIKKFKGTYVNTSITNIENNESKCTIVEVLNELEYKNNITKTQICESEDEKGKGKKLSKKEEEIIQSETINIDAMEPKKKTETDDNTLNKKREIDNDHKEKHERKLDDASLNKKYDKPPSESRMYNYNKSSSEEESESEEDLEERCLLIDEEAIDAGDDYKSGDSQDESERRYQKQNEVIDKGETLTTDDEFSDDSDYEKDSFIVSSNEEDDELLDGTDDDISMSDKELKMTAKSKQKYNERKVKEQKEASREMFDSRHNSSNKSKKNRRLQISSSESEKDIKPRKYNRLRLDSTKEASLLGDISEHKISIKKNKQLPDSDSSSDESVSNEKEITIYNESIKESDPLSAQVKKELKTPQKSANSTIAFVDSVEVNNDEIDKNESTMTQSEFRDPLQATMFANDDDDSLSSDNENIIQNYDSVLKGLNSSKKINAKVCDISLNLETKINKKGKTTIVDELNLTQVKSSKKPTKKKKEVINASVNDTIPKKDSEDGSSDSIDLHLLFSEDSNNSDTSSLQNKMKATSNHSEEIIPLKRTEAKTDIRKSKDKEEGELFFVDTVGSLADLADKSNDLSLNKHKNEFNAEIVNFDDSDSSEDPPKEQNTEKDVPMHNINLGEDETDNCEGTMDKSGLKTPKSEKKKKRQSEPQSEIQYEHRANQSLNISKINTPSSHKKKTDFKSNAVNNDNEVTIQSETSEKKKHKKFAPDVETIPGTSSFESKTNEKKKRKKSASSSFATDVETLTIPDIQDAPIESKSIDKKKHKKSASNSFAADAETLTIPDIEDVPIDSKTSEKKKNKKSASNSFAADIETLTIPGIEGVPIESKTSEKKKKKKSASSSFAADVESSILDNEGVPIESKTSEKKKNKKSASSSFSADVETPILEGVPIESKTSEKKKSASNCLAAGIETVTVPDNQDVQIQSEISGKKKRKRSGSNSVDYTTASIPAETTESMADISTTRKRKSSVNSTKEENLPSDVDNAKAINVPHGSRKKKRKIIQEEVKVAESVSFVINQDESAIKNQEKKSPNNAQNSSTKNDQTNKKRNKKRKEPEDDDTVPSSKVMIFDKVPRLPPTLLEKLDVPHQKVPAKKPKLISTTQFLVEETKKRKTKPSHYLEESIYLNESTENKRNKKKHLEKPKVLPFMPTVSTSDSGFTTNFKINVLPSDITFAVQTNSINSFRNNLYRKNIKKQGTYDLYRNLRNVKLSKF